LACLPEVPEITVASRFFVSDANAQDTTVAATTPDQEATSKAVASTATPKHVFPKASTASTKSVLEQTPVYTTSEQQPAPKSNPKSVPERVPVVDSKRAHPPGSTHERAEGESSENENQEEQDEDDDEEDKEPPKLRLDKGKGRAVEITNLPPLPASKAVEITKSRNTGGGGGGEDGGGGQGDHPTRKTCVVPLSERTLVIPNVIIKSGTGPLTVERKRNLLKKKQPLNQR